MEGFVQYEIRDDLTMFTGPFNRLNNELLEEITLLLSNVFPNGGHNSDVLTWKHGGSPVGASVVSFVISPGHGVIAFRAFQCVLLGSSIYWQPCDTAVHTDYRGQGLFGHMTLKCLDYIGLATPVVNFPNRKSIKGYLKLGWQKEEFSGYLKLTFSIPLIRVINNYKFKFTPQKFVEGCPSLNSYFNWRLQPNKGYIMRMANDSNPIIFRLGNRGKLRELQLLYSISPESDLRLILKDLRKSIKFDIITTFKMSKKIFLGSWIRVNTTVNCVTRNKHKKFADSFNPLVIDTV